jgi:alpha-glucosidase
MFAYRHDILKALIADGAKLVVLGSNEKISDLPEIKALDPRPATLDVLARFMDYSPEAKLLVVSEENVMANPRNPNVGDNQVIRVFARALHRVTALRPVDPNWENRGRNVQQYELRVKRLDVRFDEKLKELHTKATGGGKWKGTSAINDHVNYWAAGVLAWFDALGQDAAPNDAPHPINTREALKEYDPDLYALVNETMAYAGHVDWRLE